MLFNFEKATQPTMYFIGVTTMKSSIMKLFPKWANTLNLKDAVIKGIDLPLHAPAKDYIDVVQFIKNDPLSMGALVTTHKLDLFNSCKDMFDHIDTYAEKLEEVSSLSKHNGNLCAHAKDPITSGLALENFVPNNFWKDHNGYVLLIGAGGSSLAMSMYLSQHKWGDNVPKKIIIANRSIPRLEEAKHKLNGLNDKITFEYIHNPTPVDNDKIIDSLREYSLIVNATGLGKDAPGSPTTDNVSYPNNSLIWEINYRGDLIFMAQAKAESENKNLHIEDGWIYFIHGWSSVISEVFDVKIENDLLKQLSDIAMNMQE